MMMCESRKVSASRSTRHEIIESHVSAPRKYFQLPMTVLLIFGISPTSPKNIILRLLYSTYFWLVYIFLSVLNTVSKGIALPYQTNLDDLTENVSFFINHAIASFKIAIFMINRKGLMRLIETMEGEKFRHKDCSQSFSANLLIRETVRNSQAVYCLFICCLMGLILNSIITAAVEESEIEINEISNSNAERSMEIFNQTQKALPFHSWYPFSTKISPNYELTFAYQVFGLLIVGLIVLALDALVFSFMMHIKIQFRILSHNLRYIKLHAENESKNLSTSVETVFGRICNDYSEDNLTKRIELDLEKHVAHHQAIIEISEDLESVFTYQLLVQFICSLLAICMLMWQVSSTPVLSTKFASILTHMLATAFQLFLYCWFGNEMMLESLSVAGAAWDSGWYEISSRRYCYGIAMIIHRSQKVIMITAGGFAGLTLETFMRISQAAYSCFAVLKKVDA